MSDSREEMNRSYWEGFIRYMSQHYPQYQFGSPSKESYQIVPPWLRTGTRIAAGKNRKPEESIRVDVTLTNTPAEWFHQLSSERKAIEAQVGITDGRWEWDERPGKAEFHIIFRKQLRLDGGRATQYQWLADAVHRFHEVFGPRVSALK
jgi:hypothetical protein